MCEEGNHVPQIRVNMLGRFSLSVGDEVVLEDQGRSRKVWNLFAYLIANRNRALGPSELTELLCSDERSDDPAKAVKNLVYRLRCVLSDSPLPQANYIIQKGGIYKWNVELPLVLDTDLFYESCRSAKKAADDEDLAIEKYREAMELYGGRFLPQLPYEEWTAGPAAQYQRHFMECVANAFAILEKRKEYSEIIPVCERAISMDPFDEEIYKIYIKALTKSGRHREALAAYEDITNRLYSELGVNPSKELLLLYKCMLKTLKSVETDFLTIKDDLNERQILEGAYYCEYEIFKDIYRFVARGVERTGESIYILLCTLTDEKDEIPDVKYIKKNMEKLKNVISEALRKGDLFARYSCTQYVTMLPSTSAENSARVGERILKAYKKQNTDQSTKLHFKFQPLDPKVK